EVPPLAGAAVEAREALEAGVGRGREVGVATQEPGDLGGDGVHRLAGGDAGRLLVARLPGREVLIPAGGEGERRGVLPLLREIGELLFPGASNPDTRSMPWTRGERLPS